jgi:hypothetical protein
MPLTRGFAAYASVKRLVKGVICGRFNNRRRAMRATRSRTITVLLAGVGATIAVTATIGAPSAVADPGTLVVCQDGQIVIDGQCAVPDTHANLGHK